MSILGAIIVFSDLTSILGCWLPLVIRAIIIIKAIIRSGKKIPGSSESGAVGRLRAEFARCKRAAWYIATS